MSYRYVRNLDTIVFKNGKETILLNGTAFRKYCDKYGIIMKTSKDFILYMQIKNKYIPKEIFGII